ncbi:MAG: MlaC/ttg2D family ABC transporter substrate-binding protein [Alphaproteobacteria bacterium]
MRLVTSFLRIVATVWITSVLATTGAAAGPATDLVQRMASQAEPILNDKSLTSDARAEKLRVILREAFDHERMARSMMGRYWRKASKEQRSTLIPLLENYLINSYARRIDSVEGNISFRIKGERSFSGREMVDTDVVRPSGPPVAVSWQIEETDSRSAVTDVVVEGVSMIISQRADFSSVIRQQGGINGLIKLLRKNADKS